MTKDDILLIKIEKCDYKGKNELPCKSLSQILPLIGRQIFDQDLINVQNVLLIFYLLGAQALLKEKVSIEPCKQQNDPIVMKEKML